MRTPIYVILLFIFSIVSCKAQTVIVPIGSGDAMQNNPNYYLKDVNNEFGKFEGTWIYQNGMTELTLILKKEDHYQISSSSDFEDVLVGEYQYIENGTEKINTLLDIEDAFITGYEHAISGGVFMHKLPNFCTDNSAISEIKIELLIDNPANEFAEGRVILRYVNDNGIEKLEACIYDYTIMGDNVVKLDIPDGYYVLVKQ
ncbi:DUF6705 family protein [Bizionia sp.]|uniref:DUF6705 family protein n=1 Tax=Bizionia sp. TaxID=1954480 RepID=UPI003A8D3F4C